MINLRELNLACNNLVSLSNDVFFGLKNLKRLNLSSNKLKKLQDEQLKDLAEVEIIDLSNNQIKSVNSFYLFKTLPKLKEIKLEGNQPDKMFLLTVKLLQTFHLIPRNKLVCKGVASLYPMALAY